MRQVWTLIVVLTVLAALGGCTKEQAASSIEMMGRSLCEGSDSCTNYCPDGTTGSRYPSGYDCSDPYKRDEEKRGP